MMKKLLFLFTLMSAYNVFAQNKDYPIQNVPFTQVHLSDNFWLPRIKINQNVTIPASFERCEKTGRVNNFVMAAARKGRFGTTFPFDDTDIYRTIDPLHPHPWSGKERWEKEREMSHELYNAGHLYEAAAAHYYATGKRALLNVALKNADLLCATFGPDKNHRAPGHE